MARLTQAGTVVTPSRRRQREVERRLAAFGAGVGPRLLGGRTGAPDERRAARLRGALETLGPIFASFGLYLSTRIDLLPRRDCAELAAIPQHATPAPPSAVAALIARELGAPADERFAAFDDTPSDSTLLLQTHRAWIGVDRPVDVRIVRPDLDAYAQSDLSLLGVIGPSAMGDAYDAAAFARAADDFRATVRLQLDLAAQAGAFRALAEDAREFELLRVPACDPERSSARVLTLEHIEGISLAALARGAMFMPNSSLVADPETVARRVCLVWLRQSVAGRVAPFELRREDVLALPGQIALAGGVFDAASAETKANLLGYLNAAAAEDPDTAALYLYRETLHEGHGVAGEDELRRRFRQAVPFRDGEWGGDERLAEHLFVHWRFARESGYHLTPHLLRAYRGLYRISTWTDRLSRERDPLAAALQDFRLMRGLAQAREMLSVRELTETVEKLVANMVNLPRKLDEVLTLASEGRLKFKLHVPEAEGDRQTRNATALMVALILALMGIALVVQRIVPSPGEDLQKIGAVAVVIVGALLLRIASRLS